MIFAGTLNHSISWLRIKSINSMKRQKKVYSEKHAVSCFQGIYVKFSDKTFYLTKYINLRRCMEWNLFKYNENSHYASLHSCESKYNLRLRKYLNPLLKGIYFCFAFLLFTLFVLLSKSKCLSLCFLFIIWCICGVRYVITKIRTNKKVFVKVRICFMSIFWTLIVVYTCTELIFELLFLTKQI